MNHHLLTCFALLVVATAINACDLGDQTADTDVSPDAGDTTTDADPDGDGPTIQTKEVGDECNAPEQCVEGSSCIGNPDGEYTCMAFCEDVWTFCEDGSVCTPVANGSPICYTGGALTRGSKCDSNLDCQPGLLCVGVPDNPHYCIDACHADEGGCDANEHCRAFGSSGKGYCRHNVGDRCSGPGTCTEGLACSSQLDPAVRNNFAGGYCTASGCESDADCPGEAVCRTYPNTSISMCFGPCDDDTDCRLTDHYACLDQSACDNSSGAPSKCNDFRDGKTFCVPADLRTWNNK